MIRVKEDIQKIVKEYVELEELIIDTCKKLGILKNENDYCGFQYNEESDIIMVRISDYTSEIDITNDYEFSGGCLFSKAILEEEKSNFAKILL